MRSLGIDLGTKRIGVALSDSSGTIAGPLVVLARKATRAQDHHAIQALVDEYEADCVVVGMPISLSGKFGPAAQNVANEIDQMKSVLTVPVYFHDERLTTKTAHEALEVVKVKTRDRKQVVDKIAAAVMLQGWLDHADRSKS